jgi:hypothetical protein
MSAVGFNSIFVALSPSHRVQTSTFAERKTGEDPSGLGVGFGGTIIGLGIGFVFSTKILALFNIGTNFSKICIVIYSIHNQHSVSLSSPLYVSIAFMTDSSF